MNQTFFGTTVYPHFKSESYTGKEFFFSERMILTISKAYYDKAQTKLFCELFRNFAAGIGRLRVCLCECQSAMAILAPEAQALTDSTSLQWDYTIDIDESKAVLRFCDKASFAHAFSSLLALIETKEITRRNGRFSLPQGKICDAPTLAMRAIHLCVFQESSFAQIRKKVREFGFLKYSHLVLEFWGTFPYRVCKHLYRKGRSLTRRQIKLLVQEANAFGMEVIPMLNVWGHAAMNRGGYGKHTVLDQNPRLQPYFNKTGWIWNIQNPAVFDLHCKMAQELMEVCHSSYFHIGCDEASTYGEERSFHQKDRTALICDYINRISAFLKQKGAKAMMWADMLLCNPSWEGIEQNGESPEAVHYLCEHLDKEILLIDWQYGVKTQEVPSASYLCDQGFSVMIASWTDRQAQKICCDNVARHRYVGYMQTTWDSLSRDMIFCARGAICAWNGAKEGFDEPQRRMHAVMAEFARKLYPPKGNYEISGISTNELEWN